MQSHLQHTSLLMIIYYSIYCSSDAEPIYGVDMNFAVLGSFNFLFLSLITNRSSTDFEEKYLCTSTLISKRFVMTIAECVKDLPIKDLEVTFGYVDKEENENSIVDERRSGVYPAKRKLTFTEWSEERGGSINVPPYNDIALVELHDFVSFKPAVISFTNNDQKIGARVLMQGWGKIKSKLEVIQPDLPHQAPMKIMSKSACENKVNQFAKSYRKFKLSDNVFCMTAPNLAVALHSDIGGPVLDLSKKVIGMTVKRIRGTASYWLDKGNINFALRLGNFREFIESVAGLNLDSMRRKFQKLTLDSA